MSRLRFLSMAALIGGILSIPVQAEDTEQANSPNRYQLRNRSSFAVKDTGRVPFWPIGHVKRGESVYVAPAAPVTQLDPEMFAVTSILLGNPSLAVINGRAYGEGEYLRPVRPSAGAKVAARAASLDPRVRVRVIRIMDGQVTLQSMDGQSVLVPLRRNEVSAPPETTAPEALLDDQ